VSSFFGSSVLFWSILDFLGIFLAKFVKYLFRIYFFCRKEHKNKFFGSCFEAIERRVAKENPNWFDSCTEWEGKRERRENRRRGGEGEGEGEGRETEGRK
jgi:hypothetical protein